MSITTIYYIEVWNKKKHKYEPIGVFSDGEEAKIQFNKPCYIKHSRRLIKCTEELICKAKEGKGY